MSGDGELMAVEALTLLIGSAMPRSINTVSSNTIGHQGHQGSCHPDATQLTMPPAPLHMILFQHLKICWRINRCQELELISLSSG